MQLMWPAPEITFTRPVGPYSLQGHNVKLAAGIALSNENGHRDVNGFNFLLGHGERTEAVWTGGGSCHSLPLRHLGPELLSGATLAKPAHSTEDR